MISEKQLHKQICDYLKAQYKDALFNTDLSGIKLTIGQAKQAKELRSESGFADIVIYETYIDNLANFDGEVYSALFLEVKKGTPYKKNGELKKMIRYEHVSGIKVPYDHLQRQNKMHIKLRYRGYKAEFVWSFLQAKGIIDEYLK